MPRFPDPALRFLHSANRDVLAYLRCQATPATTQAPTATDRAGDEVDAYVEVDACVDLDGYILHTHPDLWSRLLAANQGLPVYCDSTLYGCAILSERGIIFALAQGGDALALRLGATDAGRAQALGLPEVPVLGEGWFAFDAACQEAGAPVRLAEWCRCAFAEAHALPERPHG